MSTQSEIERIAEQVIEEHNQSEDFKDRFLKFYQNTIEDNLGNTSLDRLIDSVELPEEDELDGS
ncbi:hypothetical protein BG842_14070 [Haladaptatus sp. W1]|uniref:CxC ATPase DNA modification system associated small protein n=1 Tax=Haladaptatus sp. W1 TaxID=1897478 RepID=UPI000849C042|nr:CxC ATPase DNA modification system associated small protein [Haladaptatus sp. W1]ODR83293.1 hypothetical protein BG842_14070 [Haladaptatus sp. W1]